MSTLRKTLTLYLETRRSLGFKLYRPGKALERFVRFVEGRGAAIITTELALEWADSSVNGNLATRAERLDVVRRFARFCKATNPKTEIPPQRLLPYQPRRKPPYIYTDAEINELLANARILSSKAGLRRFTYETLFGLLACTGMRVGEALGLDETDVDTTRGILTVRNTKFAKTRLVPIHASTNRILQHYAEERNRRFSGRRANAFFVTENQTRLSYEATNSMFRRLAEKAKIRTPQRDRQPRIHDFRHTFAVRILVEWYRAGLDVDAYLPRLSTYLGHTHVTDTYWYLSAIPELMQLAMRRLEVALGKQKP